MDDSLKRDIAKTAGPNRTICEVLREMYDIAQVMHEEDLRDEMIKRIYSAYEMAKKMNRKLREQKHNWDEGFWEENKNWKQDLERRALRPFE